MGAEIHIGDEPIMRATIKDQDNKVVDVSGASTLQIKFKKPSGTVNTRTAILTTTGADGKIEYQIVPNEFDEEGEWQRQARVVLNAKPYNSDILEFKVHKNL